MYFGFNLIITVRALASIPVNYTDTNMVRYSDGSCYMNTSAIGATTNLSCIIYIDLMTCVVCFREVSELVVSVIQGRDLETNEVTGTLDSYVKVWISPHKQGKVQTKVITNTLIIYVNLSYNYLARRVLLMFLYIVNFSSNIGLFCCKKITST